MTSLSTRRPAVLSAFLDRFFDVSELEDLVDFVEDLEPLLLTVLLLLGRFADSRSSPVADDARYSLTSLSVRRPTVVATIREKNEDA